MQSKLSKENLTDFAQQAVNSLRRLVGSGGDSYTPAQQDLVNSSKQVEERWHRHRMPVDAGTVELWCAGLRDELAFLTTVREAQDTTTRKPLTESAMISALEAARILTRTTRLAATENFITHEIIPLLVRYFMMVPLGKKLREICALVLTEIPGEHTTLMEQCMEASLPFLLAPYHNRHAATPSPPQETNSAASGVDTQPDDSPAREKGAAEPGEETAVGSNLASPAPAVVVDTRAVYLSALLVAAIHRADSVSAAGVVPRDAYPVSGAIELMRCTHFLATAPAVTGNEAVGGAATGSEAGTNSYQTTVVAVYLSLISAFARGSCDVKSHLVQECGDMFCQAWVATASGLGQMDTIVSLPTTTPGKDTLTPLLSSQAWQGELLELLIELVTDDSFTLRRLSVYDTPEANNSPMGTGGLSSAVDSTPSNLPRSPGHQGSPTASGTIGVRRFEPVPPHWDTILTGGSTLVWRTASRLSSCLIRPEAVGVLEQCLLGLDMNSVFAESMYRNIIMTLMLLCAAVPHNAQRLADNVMFECVAALVTHAQKSVFASEVRVPSANGDGHAAAILASSTSPLTTNTTQLTESFMCSLAAVYFPRKLVQMLMRGVASMSTGRTCQTDADIVEALLHVLSTTFKPTSVLFFPGCGSVVCKVDGFPGRWTGYSFSAWVNPMCVWAEGSHLFSFTEDAGTSVTLSIVANGRSCCLALRVQTSKELAMAVIPESNMAAESWSHIVFTQALSGVSVFVNGRKLPAANVSVPFPQAPSKRHRLDLAFGGALEEPSFYGYVASMDLLDEAISEKDVGKLFARGPARSEASGFHPMLSVSAPEAVAVGATEDAPIIPVAISGSLFKKRDGVSLHGVSAFSTPDMQSVFEECGVVEWALRTLKASHNAANFSVIAKLCISFIATAMRLATSDAELGAVLQAPDGSSYLDALKAEVLTWDEAFLEFPSIMLLAATLRGGGKALRDHPSTQALLSLLLERLEVVCGCTREGVTDHGSASGGAAASHLLSRNVMSACSILRELSDALLVEENVRLFKAEPSRFDRILNMSLYLPPECIESVVILVEKLCKRQPELERTLRFLVQATPGSTSTDPSTPAGPPASSQTVRTSVTSPAPSTAASASLRSVSITNADVAKAEIVRMLFDVARADVSMCELISVCFKGTGASFLILLVSGRNHASEAVRVFALRLLSLMLHVNRKFREGFVKSHGFAVLSRAITDPHSRVPIRLPTVDCLFQMAFDGYRPADGPDAEMASRLSTSSQGPAKGKTKKSKHHDVMGAGGGLGRNLGLPGHLPGLVSRRLKVTRREYSFEVAHDFARVDDRLQFDEAYRSRSAHSALHVPPAFETALCVLGSLIAAVGAQGAAASAYPAEQGGSAASPSTGAPPGDWAEGVASPTAGGPLDGEGLGRHASSFLLGNGGGPDPSLPTPGGGGGGHGGAGTSGDGNSSVSGRSPVHEEEPLEKVVARVLGYVEKVIDVEQNGLALLQYPWMDWVWNAVQAVAVARRGNAAASPSSPGVSGRYSKKFTTMVMSHTRHIIRKLVVLDMTRNSKAVSIRRLRGIQQPPYLIRIVLEEVVRQFIKGKQEEMSGQRAASNVIRNLDALFHNIEYTIDPLPLVLGTEIVSSISAIAVRNNSWVRMHMKKDSDLFEIRDHLAFYLLISIKHFTKPETETLLQLIDANSNDLDTATILLYRLSVAVNAKDLDEVEILLVLIRRLATFYEDQLREVYRRLGEAGVQLAELLCVTCEDVGSPSSRQLTTDSFSNGVGNSTGDVGGASGAGGFLSQPGSPATAGHSGASAHDPSYSGDAGHEGGGPQAVHRSSGSNPLVDDGTGGSSLISRLPISQVIDWCRTHPSEWTAITETCKDRAQKRIDAHLKANKDRVEKEHNSIAKATRTQREHQEHLDSKVDQELSRIRSDVEVEVNGGGKRGGGGGEMSSAGVQSDLGSRR